MKFKELDFDNIEVTDEHRKEWRGLTYDLGRREFKLGTKDLDGLIKLANDLKEASAKAIKTIENEASEANIVRLSSKLKDRYLMLQFIQAGIDELNVTSIKNFALGNMKHTIGIFPKFPVATLNGTIVEAYVTQYTKERYEANSALYQDGRRLMTDTDMIDLILGKNLPLEIRRQEVNIVRNV